MRRWVEIGTVTALATVFSAAPAFAGICSPVTPAPVIGLGIPALAAFGFAYKRLRGR